MPQNFNSPEKNAKDKLSPQELAEKLGPHESQEDLNREFLQAYEEPDDEESSLEVENS